MTDDRDLDRFRTGGECIVLRVKEWSGNGEYPCEPRRRPDVRHVLASLVLIDPGTRRESVDSGLYTELLL